MKNILNNYKTLNNGLKMPSLGFGVFQIEDGKEVEKTVSYALEVGYRSIDTASVYGNELDVGKAIKESGIPREEIFLTTKVWNNDQRKSRTSDAFKESLERLQTDYIDLYLIHWPVAGYYQETWKEMEAIYQKGFAKSIGVSNFLIPHLKTLLNNTQTVPCINQMEFHPYLVQPQLLKFCESHKIQMEAWSPLMQGNIVSVPTIQNLAKKYKKTPAQIVLRWDFQHNVITIPKSVNPTRIIENTQFFDFELTQSEMNLIDTLDQNKHFGPDPANFDF